MTLQNLKLSKCKWSAPPVDWHWIRSNWMGECHPLWINWNRRRRGGAVQVQSLFHHWGNESQNGQGWWENYKNSEERDNVKIFLLRLCRKRGLISGWRCCQEQAQHGSLPTIPATCLARARSPTTIPQSPGIGTRTDPALASLAVTFQSSLVSPIAAQPISTDTCFLSFLLCGVAIWNLPNKI